MPEYIKRALMMGQLISTEMQQKMKQASGAEAYNEFLLLVNSAPAADVAPVVRCKGCKHSTLPSEPTQRYGKPGTLTCHNMHAPSNRRNVGSNDFCSYGEQKDGGTSNA